MGRNNLPICTGNISFSVYFVEKIRSLELKRSKAIPTVIIYLIEHKFLIHSFSLFVYSLNLINIKTFFNIKILKKKYVLSRNVF